ncbi:MAG: type II toxin-antitoxin system HigB family toxin [Deltaproteobacteria bacterium]|nr:type II toxin-antitoxin system HigB family toxin [Deltaproteobacteria bacterium]
MKRGKFRKPSDIRCRYNSADFVSDDRVIFNIGGNKYRLVSKSKGLRRSDARDHQAHGQGSNQEAHEGRSSSIGGSGDPGGCV